MDNQSSRPAVKLLFKNKETKQSAECGVGFANDYGGYNMRLAEESKDHEKYPTIKFERALELVRQGKGFLNLVANGKDLVLSVSTKDDPGF